MRHAVKLAHCARVTATPCTRQYAAVGTKSSKSFPRPFPPGEPLAVNNNIKNVKNKLAFMRFSLYNAPLRPRPLCIAPTPHTIPRPRERQSPDWPWGEGTDHRAREAVFVGELPDWPWGGGMRTTFHLSPTTTNPGSPSTVALLPLMQSLREQILAHEFHGSLFVT